MRGPLRLEPARGRAAERREERRDRHVERFQCPVDLLLNFLVAARVRDEIARERPDFDRVAFPTWRFDPRIFRALVELLDIGACALRIGPDGERGLGRAVEWM